MKIEYELKLKTSEEEHLFKSSGELKEKILKLKDAGNLMTLDLTRDFFTRENKEHKIEYKFDLKKETEAIISIKEEELEMRMSLITKSIEKKDNKYKVSFEIKDNDEFQIDLEYWEA